MLADELQDKLSPVELETITNFLEEAAYLRRQHPPPQDFMAMLLPFKDVKFAIPVTTIGPDHRVDQDHRLANIALLLRKFDQDKGMKYLDVVNILDSIEMQNPGMRLPKSASRMRNSWTCEGFIVPPDLVNWWLYGIHTHGGDDKRGNRAKFERQCDEDGMDKVHSWLCLGLQVRYYAVLDLEERLTGKIAPLLVSGA